MGKRTMGVSDEEDDEKEKWEGPWMLLREHCGC